MPFSRKKNGIKKKNKIFENQFTTIENEYSCEIEFKLSYNSQNSAF